MSAVCAVCVVPVVRVPDMSVRSMGRFLEFELSDFSEFTTKSDEFVLSSVKIVISSCVSARVTYTLSLDFLNNCSAASVVSLRDKVKRGVKYEKHIERGQLNEIKSTKLQIKKRKPLI